MKRFVELSAFTVTLLVIIMTLAPPGCSKHKDKRGATSSPPKAPSDLAASTASCSQINLTWTDNSDNEDGFKIERKTESGTYVEIAAVPADTISYCDTSLDPSQTYYYRVAAYSPAGNSDYPNEAIATTQPAPTAVPDTPTGLSASAASYSRIDLSWTDSSDNEEGFKIERKTESGVYTEITTVLANVTSYSDTGLSPSTTYYYQVMADNLVGNSLYSNEASATTLERIGDTWTTMESMPTPRLGLSSSVVDGKIYAIGGGSAAGFLNTVEEYDPQTNSWQAVASMPTPRDLMASSAVNGKIYVMGGYNGIELTTAEEYNPLTNTWQTVASMPTARRFLTSAAVDGKVYAIGGAYVLG